MDPYTTHQYIITRKLVNYVGTTLRRQFSLQFKEANSKPKYNVISKYEYSKYAKDTKAYKSKYLFM